jgi:CTP:molybdopterin cytidylyltransferase MocA
VTRAVAGIVLAAGEGRRFGKPKALVAFDGRCLAERATRTLRDGGCRPVVIVLGASAAEVEEACDLSGTIVVRNDGWRTGMAGSLQMGLQQAEASRAEAALVLHVDQPVVTEALVHRLIDAWRKGAKAVCASYRGEALTPVVLDRSLWATVRAEARGEQGARAVLRANPHLVTSIDCDDVGDPRDIDVRSDLEQLEIRYRQIVSAGPDGDQSGDGAGRRLGSRR